MIKLSSSCSEIIADEIEVQQKKVFLPSDICQSVVSILRKRNLPYTFYDVKRSWSSIQFDEYDLPYTENSIVLVSDLFNFRSVNLEKIQNFNLILDLAHCSLSTARFYHQSFGNKGDLFMCISFGKGKYYRYGGGGIGFHGSDLSNLKLISNTSFNNNLHEDLGLYVSKHNLFSTRIVLDKNPENQKLVKNLRSRGVSVSDGLYDNISKINVDEFYVWK